MKINLHREALTDGSHVFNVLLVAEFDKPGNFISLPAVSESAANAMAEEIESAIQANSTELVSIEWRS